MTKTQIQLPDPLYREVKRLARELDWSLAEVLRRGAEEMVRRYPRRERPPEGWQLLPGKDLGKIMVPVEDWRTLAQQRRPFATEDI